MNTLSSPDGTTIAYDTRGEGPAVILVGADRAGGASLAARPRDRGRRGPCLHARCGGVLSQAIPHGQRRTLEGQTHVVDPAVLAPVLVEFFTA
jgi:hypothetical protein